MTWEQVSHARLPGGVLMLAVGRPYGLRRDSMMSHSKASRFSQILWDSAALMSFQVPIYAAIVALSGATGTGLLMGILGAAIMMIALGGPYGAFLNGVKHLFGLPPGGKKPMSLNN